jgi:PAS domain S-box-containing protein
MDDLNELLSAAQLVVFASLGAIAIAQWQRRRTVAAAWLAATFGTLGAVLVGARLLPEGGEGGTTLAVRVLIVGIILFPYLLYRFARTFTAPRRWVYAAANVVTAGLVAATFIVDLPATGEPRTTGVAIYIYVLALQWVSLCGLVTARLWRGGRAQPVVARMRMRLMGLAALGITSAIVISAFGPQGTDVGAEDIAGQVLSLVSGPLFLLGFSPPAVVRAWWRQRGAGKLLPAEMALMRATTPGEVGAIVLPEASELMGGGGALIATAAGEIVGRFALTEEAAAALAGRALSGDTGTDVLAVPIQSGVLAVQASPFTPFFGRDETELLTRVAALADLAITRTVLMEQERAATERLREAQALAHIGNWEWDVETDEIVWSEELFRIYGLEADGAAPTPAALLQFVHPEDRPGVSAELERMLDERPDSSVYEYRIVLPGGEERVVQTRGRIDVAEDGLVRRMVGTAQDITARAREEATRERFIANAAHELRTPLTSLLGFVQLLNEQESLPQQNRDIAHAAIARASDRLRTLVNNLLDLTKLQQGSVDVALERVDLEPLVDELLASTPPPPGYDVAFHREAVAAMTNKNRLEQVLVNLLTNAYRYGGPHIELELATTGGSVVIAVDDDGPGVEPDLVPHLFDAFTRGPMAGDVGGSGLGLAIAATTARVIGGSLTYERSRRGGARFVLELKSAT